MVLDYLAPLALGQPVGPAATLEGVEINQASIALRVVEQQGATVHVVTLEPRVGILTSSSKGAVVRADAGTPPSVLDAVRSAVEHADPGLWPWEEAQSDRDQQPGGKERAYHGSPGETAALLTWASLLVASAVLAFRRWRRGRPPRWALGALLAVTAVSLALRLGLSPRAFLHEYYHIAVMQPFLFGSDDGMPYGLAGPVLYRVIEGLVGGQERTLFLVNAVLASLTIPAVVWFDWVLFRRWSLALLAGLGVCLLPLHLRFSASEELWIPGILLAFGSLAAWGYWLREGDRWALAVATFALALAMQSRAELAVLPLAHAGLVVALEPRKRWLSTYLRRDTLVALAGLCILLAPWVVASYRTAWMHPTPSLRDLPDLSVCVALLRGEATPRALLVLLAFGAAWGLRGPARTYGWLLALAAAYVLIPLSGFNNVPCIYRTQMFSVALVAVAAASAPFLVEGRSRRRWVLPAAVAATAFIFVHGLLVRVPFVRGLGDQQQEFAFQEKTVPDLPAEVQLISATFLDAFPTFLAERHGKQIRVIDFETVGLGTPWPEPSPGLLFYQGMHCYFSQKPVPPGPMLRRCQEIREHYEMQPLFERTLKGPGYSQMTYVPSKEGPFDVGFYEITGLRKPAAMPAGQGEAP
jgi:hypothetical protein